MQELRLNLTVTELDNGCERRRDRKVATIGKLSGVISADCDNGNNLDVLAEGRGEANLLT
jgi:hypothetical protein